jgi:hypothetical protein
MEVTVGANLVTERHTPASKGKAMSDSDGFAAMSDPDFLSERARVREELQRLTERYQQINDEFDRRARTAWAPAVGSCR